MGRITEFFYFINQDDLSADDDCLYAHLAITEDIKKLRKEHLKAMKEFKYLTKGGLKPKEDGTFLLF